MFVQSWYDFLLGVISTLIVALIVNFLTKTYQRYTREIDAADKPQLIIQKTEKTPKEVVDAADAARIKRLLLLGGTAIVCLAILYTLFPTFFNNVVMIFGL